MTRVEPTGAWVHSAWGERTLAEQFTIVALIALLCGALLSAGWTGHSASAVLATIAGLALACVLLPIIARRGDEIAVDRRAARGGEEERVRLHEQNADLRRQVEEAKHRFLDVHDMVLRRVGVELHDGPAQLISLALLRLDSLLPEEPTPDQSSPFDDFDRIRGALQEALGEIRSMSAGLTLPELSGVSPADVLRLAARNHERRTDTCVTCEVQWLPQHVPAPIKSCLYRFAQEGLNNAYRHADGKGQTVRAKFCGDVIEVQVEDTGPGFDPDRIIAGSRLGLLGMRERIASLGGTLEVESRPGCGTRLTTRFRMAHCSGNQG